MSQLAPSAYVHLKNHDFLQVRERDLLERCLLFATAGLSMGDTRFLGSGTSDRSISPRLESRDVRDIGDVC